MVGHDEVLRRLTLGDEAFLEELIADRKSVPADERLDQAQEALLRLGALAANDGTHLSFQHVIGAALNAGLTPAQLMDAVIALAPVIGSSRTFAIVPKVALAIGYDMDVALGID